MTLAELLGVSVDMWPRLYDWTNAFVGEDDPDFRTISDFRKLHLDALAKLFTGVLRLAHEAGLVQLGAWATDGSKFPGHASRHKAMSYSYILKEGLGARIAAERGILWSFLYNKWYFDELYDATFVRGARALGDLFWKGGDKAIIDGLGPDGVSAASLVVGKFTGRLQTGYVYHYAFVMLLGIAGLLSFALWAFTR